jgi:hypothetical protein
MQINGQEAVLSPRALLLTEEGWKRPLCLKEGDVVLTRPSGAAGEVADSDLQRVTVQSVSARFISTGAVSSQHIMHPFVVKMSSKAPAGSSQGATSAAATAVESAHALSTSSAMQPQARRHLTSRGVTGHARQPASQAVAVVRRRSKSIGRSIVGPVRGEVVSSNRLQLGCTTPAMLGRYAAEPLRPVSAVAALQW